MVKKHIKLIKDKDFLEDLKEFKDIENLIKEKEFDFEKMKNLIRVNLIEAFKKMKKEVENKFYKKDKNFQNKC